MEILISPDGNRAFIADNGAPNVTVLDITVLPPKVVGNINTNISNDYLIDPSANFRGFTLLAFNSDRSRLLVRNGDLPFVVVSDPVELIVTAYIRVDEATLGVAVDTTGEVMVLTQEGVKSVTLFGASPGTINQSLAVPAAAPSPTPRPATTTGEPKYGGTLTMALMADHQTLDPPLHLSVVDIAITQATYDNLLMIQPDFSLKPELATSWEANDDLSSYTFHLRKGVKFHHGKDFKAEDVLFTFNRLLDPVLDSPARPTFSGVIWNIVAVDDYTVRFDLYGPNAFFPDSLSIYQARIVPSDVNVSRLTLEEFGSGPFKLVENLFGFRTTLVRNEDYWEEGKPYLDEIVILNIPVTSTRIEALKSGDVDLVYRMEVQSALDVEAHTDTVVLELLSPGNRGFDIDNRVPPFDNILVRKAIQAATDREVLRQAAFLGWGAIAYDHPFPEADPRHASQYRPPEYDPELARSLLEQAGYPDGIDLTLYTSSVSPGLVEIALALKESAAPAGINIDVVQKPENGYWDIVWGIEPFTAVSWFGRANVDQVLSIQYHSESSWMVSNYDNPQSDELIERASGEKLEDQIETYAELQRILIDDVPRLNVIYVPVLWGARQDVRGISPHPLGWALIQDGWFDR